MRRSFFVHIDSRPVPTGIADDALDAFFTAVRRETRLAGPSSSANTATNVVGLSTAVDARDAPQALSVAAAAFLRAAKTAKLRGLEIGEAIVELDTGDEDDRQLLLTGADVARKLGISRQRVAQLASAKGRFPRPLATFGIVTVWRWGDVADWADLNGRKIARRPRRKAS